jgi:hypothetical protein
MPKAVAPRELGALEFIGVEIPMDTALLSRLRRRNHDQQ